MDGRMVYMFPHIWRVALRSSLGIIVIMFRKGTHQYCCSLNSKRSGHFIQEQTERGRISEKGAGLHRLGVATAECLPRSDLLLNT